MAAPAETANERIEFAGVSTVGKQTDVVLSQSSYLSHDDTRLHFGLGRVDRVENFMVGWPNGTKERFPGSSADRLVLLVEGSGRTEAQPLPK